MVRNWVNVKRYYNVFLRGSMIWIDYQKAGVRIRKSTRLKYDKDSYRFVLKNIERYIEENAEFELKNEFIKLDDIRTIARIERKENTDIKPFESNILSFENIFNAMLREKSFLKKSTLRTYSSKFTLFFEFCKLKKLEVITDFKRENFVDFMEFLIMKNISKFTINSYFSLLGMCFSYAFLNNLIDNNIFFKPKRKLEYKSNITPFTYEEVKLLLNNATGELKLYLYIAFFTGMRVGEILALTWGDIDFENNEISITKSLSVYGDLDTPKTNSSLRTIDMLKVLKKELLLYRGLNSDRVISISVWNLREKFNVLVSQLGLCHHRLYDCRHTFASVMLSKGEEPMWVGCKMLGHKDLNITYKVYAKYLPKPVKDRAKFLELDFA